MNNPNLAFPLVRHIDSTVIAEGLTKREYIAAMLRGMLRMLRGMLRVLLRGLLRGMLNLKNFWRL